MNYELVLIISGLTTVLTIILSASLINEHRKNWSSPVQQSNIIKIILLAPLFAVDSFVGILELDKGEVIAHLLDMIKECYEAVAIHAFLMLMYDLCGLSDHLVDEKKPLPEGLKGRELHIPFPLGSYYGHVHFDKTWLYKLRQWTVQFLWVRPILSLVDLIFIDLAEFIEAIQIPHFFSKLLSVTITLLLNISVTTAVYALITFYHAHEKELAPYRPLAKFACIKGVVFFATWQGVLLKVMGHFGFLNEGYRFSIDEIELAWQDLLVCIEMGLIFCPLHMYAFPASEYRREVEKTKKTN